jgi:hypothetical protein
MLIHQIQRISTAGIMVLNHNAQNFPTLFKKSEEETKLFIKKIQEEEEESKFVKNKLFKKIILKGFKKLRRQH